MEVVSAKRDKLPGLPPVVDPPPSLYLHVPFCAAKCAYCDFYSIPIGIPAGPSPDGRTERFIGLLLQDIERCLGAFSFTRIPTVYLGGGTPSLLGAGGMRRLLGGLEALLPGPPQEFTVELNPESVDEELLQVCREGGIGRISLGIQTFHEASRRALGRIGGGKALREKLALIFRYYGPAVSADMMTGLPLQTPSLVREDLDRLLSFGPGHVSLYALTVEPETPLAASLNAGLLSLPDPGAAEDSWFAGRDLLERAGYAQYEVSNFALPGRRALHNIRYWRMENWLGFGPSASGTLVMPDLRREKGGNWKEKPMGRRYTVAADLEAYLAGKTAPGVEELDGLTLMKESLLMGLRFIEGPGEALFRRRFGASPEDFVPQTAAAWRRRGLLAPGRFSLTREGLLLLNAFLLDCWRELEGI